MCNKISVRLHVWVILGVPIDTSLNTEADIETQERTSEGYIQTKPDIVNPDKAKLLLY